MLRLFWIAIAGAAVATTGCSAIKVVDSLATAKVSASDLNTARQVVRAMRGGYNVAVVGLAHWVDRPRCIEPTTVSPLCTTKGGVIAVAKVQDETGKALREVERVVSETAPDARALTVAMDGAQAAYATFQSVSLVRGGK